MADRDLELRLTIRANGQQAANELNQVADAEERVGDNAQQASRQTQDLNNQVNQSAGVLNTMRGALRTLADGARASFGSAWSAISTQFAALFSSLMASFGGFASSIGTGFSAAFGSLHTLSAASFSALQSGFASLVTSISGAMASIGASIAAGVSSAGALLSGFAGAAITGVSSAFGSMAAAVAGAMGSISASIAAGVATAGAFLSGFAGASITGVSAAFGSMAAAVAGSMSAISVSVAGAMASIGASIAAGVSSAGAMLSGFAAATITLIGGAMSAISVSVAGAMASIGASIAAGVSSAGAMLSGFATATITLIGGAMSAISVSVAGAMASIGASIAAGVATAGAFLSGFAGAAVTGVSAAFGSMVAAVAGSMAALAGVVTTGASAVGAVLTGMVGVARAAALGIAGAFSGLASLLGGAFLPIIGQLKGLITLLAAFKVVNISSSFEQLEIRLKGAFDGVVEHGRRAMDWIKQFAVNTTYSVRQATDAFLMLKGFGLDPMDGTLRQIGDAAAKWGKDASSLEGIARQLGQAWSKGRLQLEDMNAMIDNGLPVINLLSQALGKSSGEILEMSQKGQLGRDAIRKLLDEMGRQSGGMMADRMNSLSGAVSNMGDAFDNAIDSIRQRGGFDWITQSVRGLTEAIPSAVAMFAEMGRTLTAVMRALWDVVSEAFHGIVAVINAAFGQSGQSISDLELFINMIKVVHAALIILRTGFESVFSGIRTILSTTAGYITAFADTANRALRLDFSGAVAAWESGIAGARARWAQGVADLNAIGVKGQADIDVAINGSAANPIIPDNPRQPLAESGTPATENKTKTKKAPSEETQSRKEMTQFEAGLDAYRLAFERQNALRELSKQDEKKYWDDILATYTGSSLTRAELVKKSAELDVAIIRDKAREKQTLLAEAIEAENAAALDAVAAKEQAAQQEFELGLISQAQLLAQQESFEREKFAIARRYQQQKRDLIVDDKAAYERSLNEEKALLRKHAADLTAIHNKMAVDNKEAISKWFGPIETAIEGSVNGLLQGTLTTSQALKNAWNSLVVSYIQALAKMELRRAADWTAELIGFRLKETTKTAIKTQSETAQAGVVAANQTAQAGFVATAETAKTGAVVIGEATRGAAEAAGAKQSVLLVAWRALKNIAIYALEAAAGVYASVSSIPYVGWILAPIAAAVTFVAVLGYGAAVSSSAGGEWQVSEDGKPYILHKDETVLPAHIATPLREMVEGRRASPEQIVTEKIAAGVKPLLGASAGSAYGIDEARVRGARPGNGAIVTADNVLQSMQAMQAGQNRQSVTANFNVNAIDTQGVRQFFNTHGGEIVNTLNRQGRKFNFGGAK
jgi:tape measure domain-containing protein